MKYLIFPFLLLSFLLTNVSFSQDSKQVQLSYEEAEAIVIKQLQEVYGEYYSTYFSNTSKLERYIHFIQRIEYISVDEAPQGVDNISVLQLKDKYNPSVIKHDNISEFNKDTFNVLKYFHDWSNRTVRYFRIYNTNTVLKINI